VPGAEGDEVDQDDAEPEGGGAHQHIADAALGHLVLPKRLVQLQKDTIYLEPANLAHRGGAVPNETCGDWQHPIPQEPSFRKTSNRQMWRHPDKRQRLSIFAASNTLSYLSFTDRSDCFSALETTSHGLHFSG